MCVGASASSLVKSRLFLGLFHEHENGAVKSKQKTATLQQSCCLLECCCGRSSVIRSAQKADRRLVAGQFDWHVGQGLTSGRTPSVPIRRNIFRGLEYQ